MPSLSRRTRFKALTVRRWEIYHLDHSIPQSKILGPGFDLIKEIEVEEVSFLAYICIYFFRVLSFATGKAFCMINPRVLISFFCSSESETGNCQ